MTVICLRHCHPAVLDASKWTADSRPGTSPRMSPVCSHGIRMKIPLKQSGSPMGRIQDTKIKLLYG